MPKHDTPREATYNTAVINLTNEFNTMPYVVGIVLSNPAHRYHPEAVAAMSIAAELEGLVMAYGKIHNKDNGELI